VSKRLRPRGLASTAGLHKSAVLFDFFVSISLDSLILTSFSHPYVRVRTPLATWNLIPRFLLLKTVIRQGLYD